MSPVGLPQPPITDASTPYFEPSLVSKDKPKWTDIASVLLSLAALGVAFAAYSVADRQADISADQTEIAAGQTEIAGAALKFAREEASASGRQTEKVLATSDRLARSAASQALSLAASVEIARLGSEASASAARSAADQATAARIVPFQNAIYTARLASIAEYARVSSSLHSALHRAATGVPQAAESPSTLATMTEGELLAAATVARRSFAAWEAFTAASSAVFAPWDAPTVRFLQRASNSGRAAYECFRWLGAYVKGEPIPQGWWDRVRNEAARYCDGFKHVNNENRFDRDVSIALRVMTEKLRESDTQFVPNGSRISGD